MPINGYYTTAEAAAILGLADGSVRDAVRRGALAAEQIAHRNLIPAHEIDRYRQQIQGTQGWQTRKRPGYRPNEKQRTYQQAYYQRKKAAARSAAAQPADGNE